MGGTSRDQALCIKFTAHRIDCIYCMSTWKFVWLSLLVYLLCRSSWAYLFFLPSFELLTLPDRASKERLCSLKLFLPLWPFLPPSLPTKGWLISSGAESPFCHLAPFEIGYNDWGSILRLPIALRAISALFLLHVCSSLWRGYCKYMGK